MRYSFRVWLLNLGLIGDEFKNCLDLGSRFKAMIDTEGFANLVSSALKEANQDQIEEITEEVQINMSM